MPTPSEPAPGQSRPLAVALSALLTGLASLYIFVRVDWSQLALSGLQIGWVSLGAGMIVIVGTYLVSSLRWMVLFQGRLDFPAACMVVFIGHGLNAILPARSGDVVKLLFMHSAWDIGLPAGVVRLVVEKGLDLACVALLTIVSGTALFGNQWSGRVLPLAAAFALIVLLFAAARHPALVGRLVTRLCSVVRLPRSAAERQEEMLQDCSRLLHGPELPIAAALSLAIWFILQYVVVALIARSIGVQLDYLSALLVIAFGALSVGLPAAPAGIGVYHAAVMGALELLGHSAGQGLIVATVLHLANTLPVVVLGGIGYSVRQFGRNHDRPVR